MTRDEWDKLTSDEQWAKYQKVVYPQVESLAWPIHEHFTIRSVNLDDKGNPPPPGMVGDMFPVWYDGQWWTCSELYLRRRKENGE